MPNTPEASMKPVTATLCPRSRRQRGLSLVESLMAVAVAAVAAGTALPGFKQVLEQRRLDGAAAQLHTDLQLARSSAVALNRTLRVSFDSGTHGSCYVVHTGGAGACRCDSTGLPVCGDDAQAMRSVHFTPGSVQLRSNVGSMVLDGDKGTVSPTGTLRLVTDDGRAVHVVVNIMGRLRKCSPGAAVPGYASC
jgi:type IV fimbrial biogenesis protein FimT